jgi:hypothetical protein
VVHPKAAKYDLFNNGDNDSFILIVAQFTGNGATRAIIKAHQCGVLIYYAVRINEKGEPVPLWANYLLVEYREFVTIQLRRGTPSFFKIFSARDVDSDLMQPLMVRREAGAESMKMLMAGRFNEVAMQRPFHGKGSLVLVRDGSFVSRKVRLETDVTPQMRGGLKVPNSIDGVRAVIELHKLAL